MEDTQIKNLLRRILSNQKLIIRSLKFSEQLKVGAADNAIKLTKEVLAGIIH